MISIDGSNPVSLTRENGIRFSQQDVVFTVPENMWTTHNIWNCLRGIGTVKLNEGTETLLQVESRTPGGWIKAIPRSK